MHLIVNINQQLAFTLLENNSNVLLAENISKAFPTLYDAEGQPNVYMFSVEILRLFRQILRKLLSKTDLDKDEQDLLTAVFRCYRNYTVEPNVQSFLSTDEKFLREVQSVLKLHRDPALRKIITQFLCNLTASNKAAVDIMAEVFFEDVLEALREQWCLRESAAVLYNLLLFKNITLNCYTYEMLVRLFVENEDIDFLQFLVERSLMCEDFWDYFPSFELKHRVPILRFLSEISGKDSQLPSAAFHSLVDCFIKCDHTVFQISSDSHDCEQKAIETALLLKVITTSSSCAHYLKVLQCNKSLMIHCGAFLINIHRLGKVEGNCFTPVQTLRQEEEATEALTSHPVLGFKRNLITIIGNLCYQCRVMQDLCREAELIPIILECCTVDTKNPFIEQWSILAIRNLCENNAANQEFIGGLEKKGERFFV